MLKPNQLRAARALLGLSQSDLAAKSGVSELTIINFETGKNTPMASTLQKLSSAVETAGGEFTEYEGVRLRPTGVETLEGQQGYFRFFDDVHNVVAKFGGDICIAGVDESLLRKWATEEFNIKHAQRMSLLNNFSMRCLIKEGDTDFSFSKYCDYRWVRADHFRAVPFYVYGNKLAFLKLTDDLQIFIINQKDIAEAFRAQFEVQWNSAIIPTVGGKS